MLNVGIIGLGLIGGSLALALKKNCRADCQIYGLDLDADTVNRALNLEIIDQSLSAEAIGSCGIIFICTPLSVVPNVIDQIRNHLRPGTIVTDVGSVKSPTMSLFSELLPAGVTGIGGHPMAGSDKSGLSAADSHLFENAVWVLTPPNGGSDEEMAVLTQLLAGTGASIRIMTPEQHDLVVSRVSHLPHLAAVCLVNNLLTGEDCLGLAGGGFRDTTRIASSQADLWADILISNRAQVMASLDGLVEKLAEMRHTLSSGQRHELVDLLQSAKEVRDSIPWRRESLRHAVDVIAMVPDQPGIIGRLGLLLGDAGININDMQVLGVRDEDEGSLRLAIPEGQAEQAVDLLGAAGIRSWIRD